MIINVLYVIIWAIIVPFLLGMLLNALPYYSYGRSSNASAGGNGDNLPLAACLAFGYVSVCAIFQLLAVPMVYKGLPFHVLKISWIVVALILSVLSVIVNRGRIISSLKGFTSCFRISEYARTEIVLIVVTLLLIGAQTWLLAGNMHTDTDDARFVAEALEAYEKDTMLKVHPLTGEYLGAPLGEMNKDVASPYPIFIALLASLYGIHPAITAHVVLPMLFIPLCYICYWLLGRYLFRGDRKKTWLFMFFLALILLFSFESEFTLGYTLLTIIWQGRSVYAMIMLPLLLLAFMRMSGDEDIKACDYIVLICVLIASSMHSGMGSVLSFAMSLAYMAVIIFRRKSLKTAICLLACLIPTVIYIAIYLRAA